ncbi:transposase, partial [Caulobacter zeae]
RDAFLFNFVELYNQTRLLCLDHKAPAELLAKLSGHNTKAGKLDAKRSGLLNVDPLQAAGASRKAGTCA